MIEATDGCVRLPTCLDACVQGRNLIEHMVTSRMVEARKWYSSQFRQLPGLQLFEAALDREDGDLAERSRHAVRQLVQGAMS